MEKFTVDRTEEGFAILEKEDMSHISVSLSDFIFPVKEGDILYFDGEKYEKNPDEKEERINKLLQMQKKLKEKSKNK